MPRSKAKMEATEKEKRVKAEMQVKAAMEALDAEEEKKKRGEPHVGTGTIATRFQVPKSTLHYRRCGRSAVQGRPSVLTAEEESELGELIEYMCEIGLGMSGLRLRSMVKTYLDLQGVNRVGFKDNKPGEDWYRGFMKRHPILSMIELQPLPVMRAKCSKPKMKKGWFDLLERKLGAAGVVDKPEFIYNVDETAFSRDLTSPDVITRRSVRAESTLPGGSGRESYTVVVCGNAAGCVIPPLILSGGVNIGSNWAGPEGRCYKATEAGWMDSVTFNSWFCQIFVKSIPSLAERQGQKVVLFVDGHVSDESLEVIRSGIDNGVMILLLPAHGSHLLQPLDVSVLSSVKAVWEEKCREHDAATGGQVAKKEFVALLKQVWDDERTFKPEHFQNGFRECGIYPFNPDALTLQSSQRVTSQPASKMGKRDNRTSFVNPIAAGRAAGGAGQSSGPTIQDYLNRPSRPSWEEYKAMCDKIRQKSGNGMAEYEGVLNDQYKEKMKKLREKKLAAAGVLPASDKKKKEKKTKKRKRARSKSSSSSSSSDDDEKSEKKKRKEKKKKRKRARSQSSSSSSSDEEEEESRRRKKRKRERKPRASSPGDADSVPVRQKSEERNPDDSGKEDASFRDSGSHHSPRARAADRSREVRRESSSEAKGRSKSKKKKKEKRKKKKSKTSHKKRRHVSDSDS